MPTDTEDPAAYFPGWFELIGRVIEEAARLEMHLAVLCAFIETGRGDGWNRFLSDGKGGSINPIQAARQLVKQLDTNAEARLAVGRAVAALWRRNNMVHAVPVAVVTPDGPDGPAPPDLRVESASGFWRFDPRARGDVTFEPVMTSTQLRSLLADLQDARWCVVQSFSPLAHD